MSNLVILKKELSTPQALRQFRMALPKNIDPERFQRIALTAVLNNEDIANCTPKSVFNALMRCAQDGLLPDNREASLVKYGQVAQYMPMVYGLIKRMRNSGDVTNVNAYCVYANDIFEYEIVNGVESIRHKPTITGNRGEFLLAYAVVGIKDANPHIEVMVKEDIERARNAGKVANGPAWKNWYEEMAKKTVIHRAAKRVPTSSENMEFLQNDMKMTLNGGFDEPEEGATGPSLVDSINDAIEVVPTTVDNQPPEPPQDNVPPISDMFPGDLPSKL